MRYIAFVTGICALTIGCRVFAACPSYTHNTDVTIGSPADLPDGWVAFSIDGWAGLFTSPLNNFTVNLVPGTGSDDSIQNIDISDDGKWIGYIKMVRVPSGKRFTVLDSMIIISPTGDARTAVPLVFPHTPRIPIHCAGFVHNPPGGGAEVFYDDVNTAGAPDSGWLSIICGLKVNLSGATPTFGKSRIISDLVDSAMILPYGGTFSMSISNDQLFGTFYEKIGADSSIRTGFLTIPGNGLDTAHYANLYRWAHDSACPYYYDGNYYGCGATMSRDGKYCLANSGWVGSACVPNKKSDTAMDHKGFYITKFLRKGVDPPIAIDSQIDDPTYGRSINWCPQQYRLGTYNQVNFNEWNFSNNSNYVTGTLKGNLATSWGIWVVNWTTNVWTPLTPAQTATVFTGPAMYITGTVGVKRSSSVPRTGNVSGTYVLCRGNAKLPVSRSSESITLYSISGKLLWKSGKVSGAGGRIPKEFADNNLIIAHIDK